jgi:subtilisin family serine protease
MGDGNEVHDHQDDDEDGLVDEAFGHGTHIAGLIRTVAPAARILPYRVMDAEGRGKLYDIAVGLERALEEEVDVVNLSFRFAEPSALLDGILDRLVARGVRVVAAAGNRAGAAAYPASHPGVIAVAAADGGALAGFSASRGVDIAAPGVELVSSYPGSGLATASGTSMATALVTGSLALLGPVRSGGPGPRDLLRATALPLEGTTVGLVNPWGVARRLVPIAGAPGREGGAF